MTETIKTTAERPLRRRDRQLTEDEALQIVRHAPHAVLSTADTAGVPYGVPVNAVYAEGNVYWHGTFMKSRKGDTVEVWKMTVTRISGKSRGWDKIKPLLTRS